MLGLLNILFELAEAAYIPIHHSDTYGYLAKCSVAKALIVRTIYYTEA